MDKAVAWTQALSIYKIWRLISIIVMCVSAGIACIIFIILVGGLQGSLFSPLEDFSSIITMNYFDAEGKALLQGQLNVPCNSLRAEAFVIDGKCYGYFGLWPSLLRLPLNILFPSLEGLWPRLMMIFGGLLSYGGCFLMANRSFQSERKRFVVDIWSANFALLSVVGSTSFFIISDPYPYHELILWASAFALWTLWLAGQYLDTGKIFFLWTTLLAAMITIHARFTVGMGVIVGLIMLFSAPFWRGSSFGEIIFYPRAMEHPRRTAIIATVLLMIIAATPIGVNYAKFGQASPPLDKQIWFQTLPGRLQKVKDGIFRFANFRCSSAIYLSPKNIEIKEEFPWVRPGQSYYWFAPEQNNPEITNTNPIGSIPLNSPLISACTDTYVEALDPSFSLLYADLPLVFLTIIGFVALISGPQELRQRWIPLLLASSLSALPTMFYSGVNYRYEHDFFPLLVIASALGWHKLIQLPIRWRCLAFAAIILCTLGACWVNFVAAQTSGAPQPYTEEWGLIAVKLFHVGL